MMRASQLVAATAIAVAAMTTAGFAQAGEPIKIGLVAPFSGDYAVYGEAYERGLDVWKEMFGDVTIDGRPIEIVKIDEGCDVNKGLPAYRRDSGDVIATIGPACSGVVKATAPLALAAKKPMLYLGHGTNLSDGRKSDGYLFRMTQPDSKLLERFAEEILKRWAAEGKKKVAVIHDTTVTYNHTGDVVADVAKKLGVELVASEQFDLGTKDFTAQLLKVRQSGAEAVIVVTYAADEARLLQQMADLQITLPVAGGSDTPYLMSVEKGAGDYSKALENLYFYSDYIPGSKATKLQEFDKRFVEKYKVPVLDINYEAWLAMGILAEALKAPHAAEGGVALRDALQKVKYDLGGRTISFVSNGDQAERVLYLGQIVDGQSKLVEEISTPAE